MKRIAKWIAIVVALMATETLGQIGDSPAGFSNRWGVSLSGSIDTNGDGALNFTAGDVSVEADFVSGVAQRVVYRAPILSERVIQECLDVNRQGAEWQIFNRPSRVKVDDGRRTWMRSDEMGSAELSAGMLAVAGHDWYRHLATILASNSTDHVVGDSESIAKEEAIAAKKHHFVGYWQACKAGDPSMVMHVLDVGTLSWIVSDDADQRSTEIQWECNLVGQRTLYTLARATTNMEGKSSVQTWGQLELVSTNRLRWLAATSEGGVKSDPNLGEVTPGMFFDRIADMPRWAPSALPAKGTPRQEVIRRLGNPTGTISLGGCEVLVYPWGKVWIAKGVVRSIE